MFLKQQPAPPEEKKGVIASCFGFLTIEYNFLLLAHSFCRFWQDYFDVTQSDVFSRLLMSLNPFKGSLSAILKDKPDLYGPFWIYTTLIFLLSATGNFSSYLSNKVYPP